MVNDLGGWSELLERRWRPGPPSRADPPPGYNRLSRADQAPVSGGVAAGSTAGARFRATSWRNISSGPPPGDEVERRRRLRPSEPPDRPCCGRWGQIAKISRASLSRDRAGSTLHEHRDRVAREAIPRTTDQRRLTRTPKICARCENVHAVRLYDTLDGTTGADVAFGRGVAAVPEPWSMALAVMGVFGWAVVLRRVSKCKRTTAPSNGTIIVAVGRT